MSKRKTPASTDLSAGTVTQSKPAKPEPVTETPYPSARRCV